MLDWAFMRAHTQGFDAYRARARADARGRRSRRGSGVPRERDARGRGALRAARERMIACWAMGLTQHRHGVANVQEIVNLLLLRGNIGKPGAGPCPVRGHSNVQGDRTVGITEQPTPARSCDRLGGGVRLRAAARARLRHGGRDRARCATGARAVFFALGGNFAVASPDAEQTAAALARCELTAHVATKLNRTHLVGGREALLLPCLGRSERDVQAAGPQFVTRRGLDGRRCTARRAGSSRPRPQLRSEPAIVAGMARGVARRRARVPWEELAADYDRIRDAHRARGARLRRLQPPRARAGRLRAAERRAHAPLRDAGRAAPHFRVHPLPERSLAPGPAPADDDPQPRPVQHHDLRPRRPLPRHHGDRRVVLLHARRHGGARARARATRVDLTSHFRGETRSAARLPRRRLRRAARLRGRLLPRGQPAGAARQLRRGQPHAELQVAWRSRSRSRSCEGALEYVLRSRGPPALAEFE